MTKQFLLSLLISFFTCIAHSQPTISMYGWLDTGYAKETGHDWRMEANDSTAWGIRGYEELGGRLQASFNIQARLNLHNGINLRNKDWDGASYVGLSHPAFGSISFGRVNDINTEIFSIIDPFNQDGLVSMFRSSQRSLRIDNTLRYETPKWRGITFLTTYSLSENSQDADNSTISPYHTDNDGYAIAMRYDRGPFILLGSWGRQADSDNSSSWNLGMAYSIGPVRLSIGYEKTIDNGWINGEPSRATLAQSFGSTYGIQSQQETLVTGLRWRIGPGTLNVMYSQTRLSDAHVTETSMQFDDADAQKYSIGYTYPLSKRTRLYNMVSLTSYDTSDMSQFHRDTLTGEEQVITFHLGIFHQF